MAFLDALRERGLIKQKEYEELSSAVEEGVFIDDRLEEKGITEEEILNIRSEYFKIPVGTVSDTGVPFELLRNIPEESALHYRFVPIGMEEGVLAVGIVDPDNTGARDAIQFTAGKLNVPYKLYLISHSTFQEVIEQYKGITGEVEKALTTLETDAGDDILSQVVAEDIDGGSKKGTLSKAEIIEEAPVTKIVAVVLRHAIEGNASDIHIEPVGDKVRVRFRVDGAMSTSLLLPVGVLDAVVARIKILTGTMKLDEKRKPQDGRFSAKIEGRKVDFRVSTFPTYYGEKVVMRILDTRKGVQTFAELGLTPENEEMIRAAIKRPYGLILLTGPTGSGKTTTLYSMLNEVDREGSNVLSLEDPVEYSITGVAQSQMRPEIGYTFASGLRSVLRQDPDIIMVGEIRDKETAQLAIQAALTGHLVFSTLHTNNAAGVIPRLVDMGVDPFLIAPTLVLTIAQRLVRRLCPPGQQEALSPAMRTMIDKEIEDLPAERQKLFAEAPFIYHAAATPTCPTGTRGRLAVYEMFSTDKEIEQVILQKPVEEEVEKVLRQKGMLSMKEDAILKALKGEIPFEQVGELG